MVYLWRIAFYDVLCFRIMLVYYAGIEINLIIYVVIVAVGHTGVKVTYVYQNGWFSRPERYIFF